MKPVELGPDARRAAALRLKTWLAKELDQDVGALEAEMLVDLFAAEIGPLFYNRGLADARDIIAAKAEDMTEALYGLERHSTLR